MIQKSFDDEGNRIGHVTNDNVPICGDYCDTCGDCLKCYGEDDCLDGKKHSWVVYLGD